MRLPEKVKKVMTRLGADQTVHEIWLIGSRANGSAVSTSDWDLLVRSTRDPSVVSKRSAEIDVLWSGPSGTVLLEGKDETLGFMFSDFEWKESSPTEATYRGRKLKNCHDGTARDASESPFDRSRQRALLLWRRLGLAVDQPAGPSQTVDSRKHRAVQR